MNIFYFSLSKPFIMVLIQIRRSSGARFILLLSLRSVQNFFVRCVDGLLSILRKRKLVSGWREFVVEGRLKTF
jgi:hypothetical protein